MQNRQRTGFTLIELLVVIAIVAVLAAIIFPVISAAKEKGRMTTCLYNLKNLSAGCRLYADANGGKLPMSYVWWSMEKDWCGCINPAYANGVDVTKGAIWQYCGKNAKIFLCPSDRNVMTTSPNMRTKSRNYPISYSMNWMLGASASRPICDTIRRPTKVLLLIHEGRDRIDDGCFCWSPNNSNGLNLPTKVHYGGSTVSYLDGHAKWAAYETLLKEQDTGLWNPNN